MLIADLARLCGLRAAVAEGWKADLTRWTIEELSDITRTCLELYLCRRTVENV